MSEALARILQNYQARLDALEGAMAAQGRAFGLPGYKHAYIGAIPIEIEAGNKGPYTGTWSISIAGPFVWTGYMATMLLESEDGLRHNFRPVSSLVDTAEPPTVSALDFLYEFEVDGTTYRLQNKPIGSPFLFSNKDRPRYLPQEFMLEGKESVTVTVTPTVDPPIDLKLYIIFFGYKILPTDALGGFGKGAPSLEQIPGLRTPWCATIDVKILKGTEGVLSANDRSYTHGVSGIFVITSLGGTWRSLNSLDDFGRFRHISGMQDVGAVVTENCIDFLFALNSGNDLRWQGPFGTPCVPSPALFTNQERPLYLPAPAIVSPGSTVTLDVDVLSAAETGILQVIMDGYIINQGEVFKGA
jgi:hypothetical protein